MTTPVSSASEELNSEAGCSRRSFCQAGLSTLTLLGATPLLAQGGTTETGGDSCGETTSELPKPKQLINPKDFPKGWVHFSGEQQTSLNQTWQLATDSATREPFIRCMGKPYGYLRTTEAFDNYEFGLRWRYPEDPNGNSGILLHTSDKDRIWPKSIQIQLHRPKVGAVFPTGEAVADRPLEGMKDLSRPLMQWNECVLTCRDGRIKVVINGKALGEVTGCTPQKGTIALQSEGSEIHFEKIWIRPLKTT